MTAALKTHPKERAEDVLTPVLAGKANKGLSFREAGDKLSAKPAKVLEHPTVCTAHVECIHLRTTRGNWCIDKLQPLYV